MFDIYVKALTYYNKALSWYADDESAVLNRAITKVHLIVVFSVHKRPQSRHSEGWLCHAFFFHGTVRDEDLSASEIMSP